MFWSKFYHFITRHISFISTFYVVFSIYFKIITKHYLKSWFRPSWAVLDQPGTTCQFKCQAEETKSRDNIIKWGENETSLKDWTLITKLSVVFPSKLRDERRFFMRRIALLSVFQDLSCKLKARESSSTRHLRKQCPKMQGQTRMVNSSLPIPH